MRGVNDLKGVGDIRTALSAHLHGTSRHKGTLGEELVAFERDKLRLERELEVLAKRLGRTRRHLDEANKAIETRVSQIRAEESPASPSPGATGQENPGGGGPWRTMKVEY